MLLSKAIRPLGRLSRQHRAFSAAPQPVYEPHVVLHQRPGRNPAADGATRSKAGLRRCEKKSNWYATTGWSSNHNRNDRLDFFW